MNHMDEKTIKANVSSKLDDSLVPAEAQPFLSPENKEPPPPLNSSGRSEVLPLSPKGRTPYPLPRFKIPNF